MILKFLLLLVSVQIGCQANSEPKVNIKVNLNVDGLGGNPGSYYGLPGNGTSICQKIAPNGCLNPKVMEMCRHKCPATQPDPEICQYISTPRKDECNDTSVKALCPVKCTERDPEICKKLDSNGCNNPMVLELCPHLCPKEPEICENIDKSKCEDPSVKALCPKMCPPICAPECDKGFCSSDDTCTCDDGWGGNRCQEAACDPPCVNGRCSAPNVCSCDSGWKGETCDQETSCEDPWKKVDDIGCFLWVVQDGMDWDTARASCQAEGDGSDLAAISDSAHRQKFYSYMDSNGPKYKHWWLGGNDRSGEWLWLDNKRITEGWVGRQPDEDAGSNTCLGTRWPEDTEGLFDYKCNNGDMGGFICKK